MRLRRSLELTAAVAVAIAFPVAALAAGPWSLPRAASTEDESRWKDRLPDEDRQAVETGIGFAAPEFEDDVEWISGKSPAKTLEDLRGRVVVLQTWTSETSAGRSEVKRLERVLAGLEEETSRAVVPILLHVPGKVETAKRLCERLKPSIPVAIDPSGRTCDAYGAFERPVNIVIDRQGTVRYGGLSDRGLRSAIQKLAAEPHDPDTEPKPRPEPDPMASSGTGNYPPIAGSVGSAADLRGRPAPPFVVERWVTPEPDARGKIAIIDFWATWCGPCVRAIPHMNELAQKFRGKVECLGLSDERHSSFEQGLARLDLGPSAFRYSLALDSQGRMKNAFQIRGIPHVAVISTDWVVRWQGHPSRLTEQIIQQIVDADPGLGRPNVGDPSLGRPPARWSARRG